MARRVLITGASRGIGAAVAARFAADGSDVVVTGRDAAALTAVADGLGARAVRCDHTDVADVRALATQVGDELDVLVLMAGGNTDLQRSGADPESLEDVATAWQANLDANVLSSVLTVSALVPAMRAGGAVVTVGSIGAEYASSSYGAAKAAVAAWTAGLSAQLGPRGVTVNCISPGYIEDTDFFAGKLSDERRATLVAATHDRRPGRPDDVAALAYFLASDGARHMTGQTLHVNGGAHSTR